MEERNFVLEHENKTYGKCWYTGLMTDTSDITRAARYTLDEACEMAKTCQRIWGIHYKCVMVK